MNIRLIIEWHFEDPAKKTRHFFSRDFSFKSIDWLKKKKNASSRIHSGYQDFTDLNYFLLWACMNNFSLAQSEFTNYHYEKDLHLLTRYLLTLIKIWWTAGNMKICFFAVSLANHCDCPANHCFLATKLTLKLASPKRSDIIDVTFI